MVESPLMISVAGVRGIVGQSLTADVVLRWAEAFGFLCGPGPVVVGGDSRLSKTMMRAATFAGLAGAGSSIIDCGVAATPTIGLAVEHHRARGGIAITASHNPTEWNALKFFNSEGLFLGEEDGGSLRNIAESGTKLTVSASAVGSYVKDESAVQRHIEAVLRIPFLKLQELRAKQFRVGLDCVNGAGGELLSRLLEELGCDVVGFNLEPTGIFPRNPEPLPENLVDVCAAMKNANVDVGFVTDPDGDRLAVILEHGEPAGEELTVVAACDLVLRFIKGPVVVNCSTTRAVEDIAARHGVSVARTKVGEAHVARAMKETGAVIGGEGNGGVMLPSIHAARDAAVGIALILQAIHDRGTSASGFFESLPHYSMVKHRVSFSDLDALRHAVGAVEKRVNFGSPDRLDGLKWNLDNSWVQVRASNTEPIVRVFAEAPQRDEAEALASRIIQSLQQIS